jgi:hypothetical protein
MTIQGTQIGMQETKTLVEPTSHGSRQNWQSWSPQWGLEVAETQQPERVGEIRRGSVTKCRGVIFVASSKPWSDTTTGQPGREPRAYQPPCKRRPLTSCIAPPQKRGQTHHWDPRRPLWNHKLAMAYCPQLNGESLQSLSPPTSSWPIGPLPGYPRYFSRRKDAYTFVEGALNQAPRLDTANATAGLCLGRAGPRAPRTEQNRTERPSRSSLPYMHTTFSTRLAILPWRWWHLIPPKCWYSSVKLHGVTFQKTVVLLASSIMVACHVRLV